MSWTDKTYNAALDASSQLVTLATELNDALGAGGGATSPADVLQRLQASASAAESVRLAALAS